MTNIVEFLVAIEKDSEYSRSSSIYAQPGSTIQEKIGPENYEKYCYFSQGNVTIPHIDVFAKCNAYKDIILTGNTELYDIPLLTGDTTNTDSNLYEYSIKQYFLEHKTRNGIQYLFHDNEILTSGIKYTVMIPGLVYLEDENDNDNGEIFGYLHSYVADSNGNVTLELPYPEYTDFSISSTLSYNQNENKIIFEGVNSISTVKIYKGLKYVEFKLFPSKSNNFETYKIKNVNEFADYIIASQFTDNKITNVINMLTEIEFRDAVYYPKYFISLKLHGSSETVKNNTPNLYKVPAALVIKGNDKVFMKDVVGISANAVLYQG